MVRRRAWLGVQQLVNLADRQSWDDNPDWKEALKAERNWLRLSLLWTRLKLVGSTFFLMMGITAVVMAFALPLQFESWLIWLICLMVLISTSMNLAGLHSEWRSIGQIKRDLGKLRRVEELYSRRLKLVI